MAHSNCRWTCGCAGKTVKSLENTCDTWALLRWWFTTKRHYIKCMHLYLFTSRSWSCLRLRPSLHFQWLMIMMTMIWANTSMG